MDKNQYAIDLFEGYINILKRVLPSKLGFENIIIETPEIILKTKSGEFSIDAVSGGIGALIEITWQVYMFAEKDKEFVILFDEPENHLHPELQKDILPNLLNAFPNVQFIVSTHSPFIISSVKDSNIYVLDYNEDNKIISKKLNHINKSGWANEILRDVLGIPSTMPLWAEDEIEEILNKYLKMDITKESINEMRKELTELGFEKLIPSSIVKLFEAGEN